MDECSRHPALNRSWGVSAPTQRQSGDVSIEFPKYSVDMGAVIYRIFRHPDLFTSLRVELFLDKLLNSGRSHYSGLTQWGKEAERFYHAAYNSALAQLERMRKDGGND